MATNPQNQAEGNYDPAGSTQMFKAFVDDDGTPQGGAPQGGRRAPVPQQASAGPRVGLIVGVIVALVVVAGAAWLALA
ncbi:hypothetical protein ACFU90_08240 [Streptomyces noursei]|uniref:Uncharacterized protein n=1 Tax=Streptomyces noursei TaxID=1971 RepID=A0A059WAS8_STRNR|nr:hypothetical protein [Streptomyces noursei]AKA05058.1 membrane protein [Streptomyces noursei ZPM]AIA04861.1 hypothetical protein DC74_4381 [Streptomyces noursei]EOT03430.1 hypothetical protein K530_13671 [Streptomyces noursei CCRC 11814]EXU88056.1 membrane protein [Streptomyces noursei PD-1]UWS73433.1 hypothetical protein N1H47_20605 [Streptomyces noursei]